ncbi:cytidine deaminase family protein [Schlesneria paludicola]|uniref:cytidine deaminase family protein n=1 Tax=Schlesneria paludicola TaxID=360056 RepID=UPI00029AE1D0|nr:cytidine deaminase [Schlesneria paludicola]
MAYDRNLLIQKASAIAGDLDLKNGFVAAEVGAAIQTVDGSLFIGVSIDISCGLGFCAEVAAIAQMLAHRETQIEAIVAVTQSSIIPPCGRCRETIAQVDVRNLDCRVILGEDRDVPLRELLPLFWLTE